MSSRVSIPHDPTVARLQDGTKPGWALAGGGSGEVLIRCDCGRIMGIGTHSIAADGAVSPSVYHHQSSDPGEACGWHVWIDLAGWTHGARVGAG